MSLHDHVRFASAPQYCMICGGAAPCDHHTMVVQMPREPARPLSMAWVTPELKERAMIQSLCTVCGSPWHKDQDCKAPYVEPQPETAERFDPAMERAAAEAGYVRHWAELKGPLAPAVEFKDRPIQVSEIEDRSEAEYVHRQFAIGYRITREALEDHSPEFLHEMHLGAFELGDAVTCGAMDEGAPAEMRPPPEHAAVYFHWVERGALRTVGWHAPYRGANWDWRLLSGPHGGEDLSYAEAAEAGYRYLGPAEWRPPGHSPYDPQFVTITRHEYDALRAKADSLAFKLEAAMADMRSLQAKLEATQVQIAIEQGHALGWEKLADERAAECRRLGALLAAQTPVSKSALVPRTEIPLNALRHSPADQMR